MDADYLIVRLVKKHIPGLIDVLRQSFFPDESICKCVQILQDSEEIPTESNYKVTKASKELEDMSIDIIKDGISLCALDSNTGEVLGIALNKIHVKPEEGELGYFQQYAKHQVKESSSLALIDFMVEVDSRYDLFHNGNDCYFETVFLAVKSTHKGKGIGTSLITKSAELAQIMKWKGERKDSLIDVVSEAGDFKDSEALKLAPKCAGALFTSCYSQICGRRSGYDEILIVPYTEFVYKDKNFSETLGPDQPYCTLSIKPLV